MQAANLMQVPCGIKAVQEGDDLGQVRASVDGKRNPRIDLQLRFGSFGVN